MQHRPDRKKPWLGEYYEGRRRFSKSFATSIEAIRWENQQRAVTAAAAVLRHTALQFPWPHLIRTAAIANLDEAIARATVGEQSEMHSVKGRRKNC